jgi:DNA-binding NarL/FixJ family response regulator
VTTRVLIADDQQLVRAGFRKLLDAEDTITVAGEAADGAQAVTLATELAPDVALMDIRMPRLDGIEATRRITASTAVQVLILTTYDLDEYVFEALRAGASGFLLKNVEPAELLAAVRTVARGDAVVAPRVTRRLLERFAGQLPDGPEDSAKQDSRLALLTNREREVLAEVAQGLSNAEIARRMYLSESTVKTHVGRILPKLGLRDRVQAVIMAYEAGVVVPGDFPGLPD